MNNEREDRVQEPKGKHKYRLNKRKFAVAMSMLCFAAAAVVIAIQYITTAADRETVAALNPPLQTTGAQDSDSLDSKASGDIRGRLIVVDAGHGGFDPGAKSETGTREDELNLKVAMLLKAELESLGAEVIMTRQDEEALAQTKEDDMAKRREIIEQSGSDIVVSVHMNSFPEDPSVSGPLVLYMTGSEKGKLLARSIIDCMNGELKPDKNGKIRAEGNLYILKSGYQPCVIVECGYLTNAQEGKKLASEDYQQKVAESISKGVAAYFNGQ